MIFVKKIIYNILSIQEKLLMHRLENTLGAKNFSKHKKKFANGCMLSLDTVAEAEKEKLEEELTLILKSADYNPLKVLEYIENQGTRVYYIDSVKSLNSIGENEGFIYPQKGFKALYISLLTTQKCSFKTDEMFILSKGEINKYYFIYHFYNWYTFKHNIAGIDAKSQELLNKYLNNDSDEDLKTIQLADIYKLKNAIKHDKAAIEFVFKLCQKYDGAKKALEKMKDSGAKI